MSSETFSARKTLTSRSSQDIAPPFSARVPCRAPPGAGRTASDSRVAQHTLDAALQPRPALLLERELLPAGPRDGVEARLAILLGHTPLGPQPAILRHAMQRGIQRSFFDAEKVIRDTLDVCGHGVPVHRSAVSKGLEYQQDQRTLENVVF